jgi:hypothetical protein
LSLSNEHDALDIAKGDVEQASKIQEAVKNHVEETAKDAKE